MPFYNTLVLDGFPYFLSWCQGGANLIGAVVLGAAQAQWGTPLIITLGSLAILVFTFEMFPIAVDLPMILWFAVSWAIMSVTALLDLLAFTKHLLRPANQIALLVTAVNILLVLVYSACIAFGHWT